MSKPETVIADIYDAWRMQNLDWLATYLPEDFCHVMYFPTALDAEAGACRGKARVLERWRRYMSHFDFLRFETKTLLVSKDRAAAEIDLHYRHRQSGVDLKGTKANFWTLEEGWPVQLTEYYDVAALEAFAADVRGRLQA